MEKVGEKAAYYRAFARKLLLKAENAPAETRSALLDLAGGALELAGELEALAKLEEGNGNEPG